MIYLDEPRQNMDDSIIYIILIGTAGAALLCILAIVLKRKLSSDDSLKYEFITIIAHKFRTPLTQIKWTSEGLIADEADPYKKQQLSEIRLSNENLIKLTSTLVELTDAADKKNDSYKMERLDLCALAKEAMEASKTAFHEKNLFMSMTCAIPEIFVKADSARLGFVLSTLMENACSYTPPGRNIAVGITATKRRAAISVADDGIGIEPKDLSRMFTKFFRTGSAQAMDTEGLGIGLYLARSITKRHNGTIEAYSEGAGKGSTFSVILPRVK